MKRYLFLLLGALSLPLMAQSQADTLVVSHCDGQLSSTGTVGCSGKQWNEAATRFTSYELRNYAGTQISDLRIGFASKLNVDTVTVWVRTSLEGENLAQGTTANIQKGWLQVAFDAPYTIPTGTELYVGFDYHQKGSSKCLSVVEEIQSDSVFFFRKGENDWQDYSYVGTPSIEALVTGSNLPLYDLELSGLTTRTNYVMGTEMELNFDVRNRAAATVQGFTATVTVGDLAPVDLHVDCSLPYGASTPIQLRLIPDTQKKALDVNVDVTITKIDGGEDVDLDNNSGSALVNIVLRDYVRHMLIEEFTGEGCVNCPPAAEMLHQLLDDEYYAERVSAVCHHIGYYADWLTTDNATQYTWFYNSVSTYAPAFMWDRVKLADQNAPVTGRPLTLQDMKDIVNVRLSETARCGLEATCRYDSMAQELHVNVVGDRCIEFCNTPARVTVFVVENNIKAVAQSGATQLPYYHQHALRGYNATFGSIIEWDEQDCFSYDCTIVIKPAWKKEDLRVIAFVAGYDVDDPCNCAIENSCEIGFPAQEDWSSGISTVQSDLNTDSATRIPQQNLGLPKGLYRFGSRTVEVY